MHTDSPIKKQAEDFLNRTNFSEKLGQSLLDWKQDDSTVIGLYGAWGSGKTSIINLAIEYMEQKIKLIDESERPIILRFNPWYFSEQDQLMSMFFNLLANEYSQDNTIKEAKNIGTKLVSYSKFFQPLSLIPGAEPWATIIKKVIGTMGEALKDLPEQEDKSLINLKDKIIELMLKEGKKVIIFIDDIDRLTPKEIKQIFQLMKVSADFPRIIYVAAFSPEDVTRALEENGISGASYLEKIVQHQVIVPLIEQKELDRYIYYSDHQIPQNTFEDLITLPNLSKVSIKCIVRSFKESTIEVSGKDINNKMNIRLKKNIDFSTLDMKENSHIYIEGLLNRDGDEIFIEIGEKDKIQKYYLSCIDQVFLSVGIDKKIIEKFDEDFGYVYIHYIRRIFKNIRQSKRFVTSLLFDLPQIKNEINLFDFLILEVIKVFNPKIYFDIPKNWWVYIDKISDDFFTGNPFGYFSRDRADDKTKTIKDHISNLIEECKVAQDEKDVYIDLISLLFPNVSEAFSRHHHFSNKHHRHEKRISSTSFLKYFSLKVSAFEFFPDEIVQRKIELWNSLDVDKLKEDISNTFITVTKGGNLIQFIAKIRIFMDKINFTTSESLIRYFYNTIRSNESNDPINSEFSIIRSFIFDIIDYRIENMRIQLIIEEIISKAPDLLLAVSFLNNLRNPSGANYNIRENVDFKKLQEIYLLRIKNDFVDNKGNIFNERVSYGLLIKEWVLASTKDEVNLYIKNLIDQHPNYISKIVISFVTTWSESGDKSIRYDELKEIYDVDILFSLANEKGEKAYTSSDEKDAVDLFIKIYTERQKNGNV